jgi:hypothetical protein
VHIVVRALASAHPEHQKFKERTSDEHDEPP